MSDEAVDTVRLVAIELGLKPTASRGEILAALSVLRKRAGIGAEPADEPEPVAPPVETLETLTLEQLFDRGASLGTCQVRSEKPDGWVASLTRPEGAVEAIGASVREALVEMLRAAGAEAAAPEPEPEPVAIEEPEPVRDPVAAKRAARSIAA